MLGEEQREDNREGREGFEQEIGREKGKQKEGDREVETEGMYDRVGPKEERMKG